MSCPMPVDEYFNRPWWRRKDAKRRDNLSIPPEALGHSVTVDQLRFGDQYSSYPVTQVQREYIRTKTKNNNQEEIRKEWIDEGFNIGGKRGPFFISGR